MSEQKIDKHKCDWLATQICSSPKLCGTCHCWLLSITDCETVAWTISSHEFSMSLASKYIRVCGTYPVVELCQHRRIAPKASHAIIENKSLTQNPSSHRYHAGTVLITCSSPMANSGEARQFSRKGLGAFIVPSKQRQHKVRFSLVKIFFHRCRIKSRNDNCKSVLKTLEKLLFRKWQALIKANILPKICYSKLGAEPFGSGTSRSKKCSRTIS